MSQAWLFQTFLGFLKPQVMGKNSHGSNYPTDIEIIWQCRVKGKIFSVSSLTSDDIDDIFFSTVVCANSQLV